MNTPSAKVRHPNLERLSADFDALALLSDPSRDGFSRVALTPTETASRYWIADRMGDAGLSVSIDSIGNVIGTLPGLSARRRALVTGSHTDTVDGGGRFDGVVGVLGAIEAVRLIQESDVRLEHDLRVVDFYGEEANAFGLSCLGSRAVAGTLTDQHLAMVDESGSTLREALSRAGWNLDVARCRWSSDEVLGFLELHVEQGPVLESTGNELGVVTSIAGISRFRAHFAGQRDHAGTTPMALRRDAGCAAAGMVLAIERIASRRDDTVGGVGRIAFVPDATSVVTERALVTAEMRSPQSDWLALASKQVEVAAAREAQRRHLAHAIEWMTAEPPTPTDPTISHLITKAIGGLGHSCTMLHSGAGHDSVQMARLGPIGMIFVPSKAGRSHCPEEWTNLSQVAIGVHALAQSIVAIDENGPHDVQ